MERGSKMIAPSTSGLSVELLLRVIDVKYGYFTLLFPFKAAAFMQIQIYQTFSYGLFN